MKRRIAALLAIIMVLGTCMTAMAASYSVNWKQAADGNWQAYKNGVLLKNTWILDDQCDVAGGLYYLVDENGNLVSNQLIRDGEGRYYTFNDQHDGHFGAMRTANGTYQGVNLTFSAVHDGSFGSITNADGIAKLAAKYGVKEMPNIKNASMVKMSELNKVTSSDASLDDTILQTVLFDVNLAAATPSEYDAQIVRRGAKLVKPASPSDATWKKEFTGWTETQDGDDYWIFEEDIVTEDVQLYAKWIDVNFLTFTAGEDNSSVTFNYLSGTDVQYCKDGGTWTDCPYGTTVKLAKAGDAVRFRGINTVTGYNSSTRGYETFSMTGKIAASGSVTSLTDFYGIDENVELPKSCCSSMFRNCTSLTSAPELPATTLSSSCYSSMFYGCTGLTEAPELPATTLAGSCYSYMFSDTGLTEAPELSAEKMENYCYLAMFMGCSKLAKAPELKATSLATGCYHSMFKGSGLTETPVLPATTLALACYMQMFDKCKELTKATELKATELSIQCYQLMFRGCSKLRVVENDITGQKIFTCPGTVPKDAVTEMFKDINGGTVNVRAGKTYSYSTQQPPQ